VYFCKNFGAFYFGLGVMLIGPPPKFSSSKVS
jgi:hypothetical protein